MVNETLRLPFNETTIPGLMGKGTLPDKSNSPGKVSSQSASSTVLIHPHDINDDVIGNQQMPTSNAETRKPVIVAGEGASPVKPTEGMPTFGTMRSGISFKNVVTQNATPPKRDDGKTIVSEVAVPGGGTSLKFGSFNASLPMRVQSAPPQLEDEPVLKVQRATLEVTPENSQAQFRGQPPTASVQLPPSTRPAPAPEAGRPFVPTGEAVPFYPQGNPYYGNGINYAPYPPMMYYPRNYGGNYYPQQAFYPPGQAGYKPYMQYPSQPPAGQPTPSEGMPTAQPATTITAIPPPTTTVPPRQLKKIAIVDPNTGQEVEIGGVPKLAKPVEKIVVNPVEKPSEEQAITSTAAVSPVPVVSSPSPRKPVILVDPKSNQAIDIVKLADKPLEELIGELDEEDVFSGGVSDDEGSMDGEEDEGDEDEEMDLPNDIQFPVILTRKINASYPEGSIKFGFPSEGEPLRYTTEFLLQFAEHCHGDAQDIASVAFPKDIPERPAKRSSGRGGRAGRGSTSSSARHLTTEQLTLTNRAEDAWKRASSMAMDEDLILLREVKQILNKLTEDKFDKLAQQILEMGVLKPAVMTGVIDMLFDKAVEEPRYAPIYARLCLCIAKYELDEKKKLAIEDQDNVSLFRKHLVTKCQIEYQAKRAYSKQRLEMLMAKAMAEANDGNTEEKVIEESSTIEKEPSEEEEKRKTISGELTEDDYAMIKTKRRVLGNMRFIGELYIVGLIPAKIMHTVIQELLGDVVNPEEEEVESVCRLIPTIGAMLDTPESSLLWTKYIERLKVLSTHPKLPTRVRFMLMDLLELRDNGWRKAKPAPPSAVPAPTGRRERTNERERGRSDARRNGADVKHYSTTNRSEARTQDVRFERVGSPRLQTRNASDDQIHRPPSTVSGTSQESFNRYQALEADEDSTAVVPSASSTPAESDMDTPLIDEKVLSKLFGVFDESLTQKNYEDIKDIIKDEIPVPARGAALKTLVLGAMEKGRKHIDGLLIHVFPVILSKEEELFSSAAVCSGLRYSFEMIDDLVVDVPNAAEFAGSISATFLDLNLLTLTTLIDSILAGVLERDSLIVAKVVLYTLYASKLDAEQKKQIISESNSVLTTCVLNPSNSSSVRSLISKLQLEGIMQHHI